MADRQVSGIRSVLDATDMAIVVVDAFGRVRMSNAAGEAALGPGGWLCPGAGGILSSRPALANGVAIATRRCMPAATAIVLTHGDGEQVVANITPFLSAPGRRDAMVLFRTPTDAARRTVLLRQLFSLTAAEAEIASLVADGTSLADVAVRRGTTLETVRAQMRIVRQKTDCGRQAELAALLNRLPV